jgi:hypothetical protein
MKLYYIVMADIIRSRSYDGADLLPTFSSLVEECNEVHRGELLSPYTVTLGDEFQGVTRTLHAAVESIFYLEEALLAATPPFRLRYVILYGEIDTAINPHVAHGMSGPGLTAARESLTRKRRGRQRFQLQLPGFPLVDELRMLFRLLDLLVGHWKEKDFALIRELIKSNDDASVAATFGKTRSQVWKRRKTLQTEEYLTVKQLIRSLVDHSEEAG